MPPRDSHPANVLGRGLLPPHVEAQVAARDGNDLTAIIVLGDLRNKAMTAFDQLSKAREGKHE